MKERRESLISIPPDWDPAAMADLIEREAVRWWDEGWVFLRAEADALLESVCLYFERTIFLEEDLPPPGGADLPPPGGAAPGGPGRLKPPRP